MRSKFCKAFSLVPCFPYLYCLEEPPGEIIEKRWPLFPVIVAGFVIFIQTLSHSNWTFSLQKNWHL